MWGISTNEKEWLENETNYKIQTSKGQGIGSLSIQIIPVSKMCYDKS